MKPLKRASEKTLKATHLCWHGEEVAMVKKTRHIIKIAHTFFFRFMLPYLSYFVSLKYFIPKTVCDVCFRL